jgi:hypothetical protein
LALYAGEMSWDIFYDKNTFGFFLTTNNGVGGTSNSNSGGCAVFTGRPESTTSFRSPWLPLGKYAPSEGQTGTYVPDSKRKVICTNSFTMLRNGAVYRSKANIRDNALAGGTFWANQETNGDVDLFGCDNDKNFLSNQNLKLQDSGVEHIIERSIMKITVEPYPLVDFVMAWQYWNKENGDLRGENDRAADAENEKKRLYGEDVYNCIEKLLGGILQKNDGQPQDSCQAEVWRSKECQSALSDVENRIKRSNAIDLIGV